MEIPDYQSLMLPLLDFASDEKEHTLLEAIEVLAGKFGLTEKERKVLLPSGLQPTFDNRVGWARTYIKKAGLLEYPRRGFFRIAPRGLEVLRKKPSKIDVSFLKQFQDFRDFQNLSKEQDSEPSQTIGIGTPEETFEAAYQKLRHDLASELIQTLKNCSPTFFERLVVDVLVKMGYGGTRQDAGRAVGKSGDDGIDGIIKEDRLGLDIIYIQAKRWEGVVGRPEVQKFSGALQGHRASKGIFITTSYFSKEADEYVSRINSKIVLIDGETLAQLMIDHNVGVSIVSSYERKRIDSDYFTEA